MDDIVASAFCVYQHRLSESSVTEWLRGKLLEDRVGGVVRQSKPLFPCHPTLMKRVLDDILKHPQTHQMFKSEIQTAVQAGQLSKLATWKECLNLPYLDACAKEAEGIHPTIRLPLERIMPAKGATICGQYFQGGTVVGIDA